MNRQQRRGAHRANKKVKPPYRQSSLALLTVAGLAGSSLGLAAPVNSAVLTLTADSCATINSQLLALASNTDGGTIDLNWSGLCILDLPYILSGNSTINGPTSGGRLTLQVDPVEAAPATDPVTYADSYALSSDSELNISHVDFTGGSPAVRITSILSLGILSDTTLTDVSFFSSYLSGSAIESDGVTTINNSTFSSNSGLGDGGAISLYGSGPFKVSDSSFDLNTAETYEGAGYSYGGYGGAIYSEGGLVEVVNSTFNSNTAQASGGAIYSDRVNIDNSTFNSNTVSNSTGSSTYGGAIGGDVVNIDNSTFYGNTSDYGAAASIGDGSLISNSTFWNNPASGVPVDDVPAGSIEGSNISFFGNILANSDGTTVLGVDPSTINDLGANLYTDILSSPSTGDGHSMHVDFADLKLISLSLNQTAPTNSGSTKTVAIGAGSIARDYYAASSSGINPTGYAPRATLLAVADQRGVFRPDSARYDVGAYEAAPVATTAVVTKATIAMQKITFGPDSSRLTIASKKKLSALATEIQAKGLSTISLEGYTATLTKAAPSGQKFRVSLSKDRASAVEKYLKIKFKKNSYEVTFTKSPKGAANPVKSNKTEKGRKANRRVEIAIN